MTVQPTEIMLAGRSYRLAVPAGEEQQLNALAQRVDTVLAAIKQADPLIDRDRQLVMACLQVAADLQQAEATGQAQAGATSRFHQHLAERLESLLLQ